MDLYKNMIIQLNPNFNIENKLLEVHKDASQKDIKKSIKKNGAKIPKKKNTFL